MELNPASSRVKGRPIPRRFRSPPRAGFCLFFLGFGMPGEWSVKARDSSTMEIVLGTPWVVRFQALMSCPGSARPIR